MDVNQALKSPVRTELDRICSSDVFTSKKQAQNFLRYIVEETLEGRGSKITQYALAVDALGKPDSFDPMEDPSVRMQATRLRKLLADFYEQEPESEPIIRIDLPTGSYQPIFLGKNNACDTLERTQIVGSMSMGPKILLITNAGRQHGSKLRHFLHELYSGVTVVLSRFREARIVLADTNHVYQEPTANMVYAWEKHQAEFVLELEVSLEDHRYVIECRLFHTLTHNAIGLHTAYIPLDSPDLGKLHLRLVESTISLHRGTVLRHWSQFWHKQKRIPDHYQVLVRHVYFLQINSSADSFQRFLHACENRIQRFHDDALAYLHYAILCLYAHMTKQQLAEPLVDIWYHLAQKSLELNPWNSLAHGIYALACGFRGDAELCAIEVDVARYANPLDSGCLHMMAAGLCSIGKWPQGFELLKATLSLFQEGKPPPPQQILLCTHFFRQGLYAELARTEDGFKQLGSWKNFDTVLQNCQQNPDCSSCIESICQILDQQLSGQENYISEQIP